MPVLAVFSVCFFLFLVGAVIGFAIGRQREGFLGPMWRRIGRRAGYKTALEVMRENSFEEAKLIVWQLYEQTLREGLEVKDDRAGHN